MCFLTVCNMQLQSFSLVCFLHYIILQTCISHVSLPLYYLPGFLLLIHALDYFYLAYLKIVVASEFILWAEWFKYQIHYFTTTFQFRSGCCFGGFVGRQVFSELLLQKITLNIIKQTPKLDLREVVWHVLKHHVHGNSSLATKEVVIVSMKYL